MKNHPGNTRLSIADLHSGQDMGFCRLLEFFYASRA